MPDWFVELACALAGERRNPDGTYERLSSEPCFALRRKLADLPGDDFYARWVRWFFADRSTRTISPSSQATLDRYVEALLDSEYTVTLREAVRLAPQDPAVLNRLATVINLRPAQAQPWERVLAPFLRERAAAISGRSRHAAADRPQPRPSVAFSLAP